MQIVEAVANIILLAIMVFITVFWLINLLKWDGKYDCDPSECESCPFPCDKNVKEE